MMVSKGIWKIQRQRMTMMQSYAVWALNGEGLTLETFQLSTVTPYIWGVRALKLCDHTLKIFELAGREGLKLQTWHKVLTPKKFACSSCKGQGRTLQPFKLSSCEGLSGPIGPTEPTGQTGPTGTGPTNQRLTAHALRVDCWRLSTDQSLKLDRLDGSYPIKRCNGNEILA